MNIKKTMTEIANQENIQNWAKHCIPGPPIYISSKRKSFSPISEEKFWHIVSLQRGLVCKWVREFSNGIFSKPHFLKKCEEKIIQLSKVCIQDEQFLISIILCGKDIYTAILSNPDIACDIIPISPIDYNYFLDNIKVTKKTFLPKIDLNIFGQKKIIGLWNL
ncbi:MAG: hypothetical protein KAS12_01695 [Candidatus Aenigmarchaeota archaeon]|nr:hypothetical protein [Candidatus Aenigmarchaeota archaeon]